MKLKKIIPFILVLFSFQSFSQEIPYHFNNTTIYDFLDELANLKLIELNSSVKPYSRKFIAVQLAEAFQLKNRLNKRQQKELDFYLKDFSKELEGFQTTDYLLKKFIHKKKYAIPKRQDLFYYKDSLFSFTVNPILGINYFYNGNRTIRHRWSGAEFTATIGKHWGIYANLRDNYESEALETPTYFTQRTVARYKDSGIGKENGQFSEMRGGVTFAWNWGSIGLVKDHFMWGDNYNGANIFSGKTPSFALIKLNIKPIKWFEFNYVHGWLFSDVVDSNRIYHYGSNTRQIFVDKFITANMFTLTPFRRLKLSFGNSIIYSDKDYAAYWIPFLFYKSVDHSLNTMNGNGQNSQMFFNISSRQLKHVHLYISCFIDEISFRRMFDKNKQSNFVSYKVGFRISDFLVQNINVTTEFTHTNPLTYQHIIPSTTFESYKVNLGHYLSDNSQEIYFSLSYKPVSRLYMHISYTHAKHGNDYVYGAAPSTYPDIPSFPWGAPFMKNVTWESKAISIKAQYQLFHDAYVFGEYLMSNTTGNVAKYTPAYLQGKQNIISFGLNFGF